MVKKFFKPIYSLLNFLFKKIFKKELSKESFKQFVKHYFVGFIGSSTNYILFNVLKFVGLETVFANTISNIVVVIESFLMQKFFTYKPDSNSLRQPVLFIINSVIYYILDTTIVKILTDILHINPLIGKMVSIVLLSPLSFISQKFIIFKMKVKKDE